MGIFVSKMLNADLFPYDCDILMVSLQTKKKISQRDFDILGNLVQISKFFPKMSSMSNSSI